MIKHCPYSSCGLLAAMSSALRRVRPRVSYCMVVSCAILLSACSGSGAEPAPAPAQIVDDPALAPESVPQVLQQLRQDPALIAPVPDIAHTQTLANTGLQVAYTEHALVAAAPAATIEKQWVFMQTCVELVGVAPVVLVREGKVEPFTMADDVVRNESLLATEINSVPIASASTLHGVVFQVSVDDFDGSLGAPSFNLRSIMGRHLWLAANLSERDYPFACAQEQP